MDLPTFLRGKNEELQTFFEEMFQTLRQGLSDNGWTVPRLTDAQITTIEPDMPVGTLWFNTTIAKLQVKTAAGVVETITSA